MSKSGEQKAESEFITRTFLKKVLGSDVGDVCWRAWWRFLRSKPGVTVGFESEEVQLLSRLMLGLLTGIKHDSGGRCVLPWVWARHALGLAVKLRGPISIGARARLLVLTQRIAMRKLMSH
jgi:hypothetical protein